VINLALKADNLKEKRNLLKLLRKHTIGDPMDPNYVRVRYVRFADDFIVSIIGPITLAKQIKEKIKNFLSEELELDLNRNKTLLTKASKGPAYFLGTEIQQPKKSDKKVVITKTGKKSRITARITIKAPINKLIEKLIKRQFFKWNDNGTKLIPTAIKRMVNMDHADIVNYYNMVVRGILNFYSHVDNRSSLGSIVRYLHISCTLTLALKYKLRRMTRAYKKFKKELGCPETGTKLYKPETLMRIRKFNIREVTTLESLYKS